MKRMLVIGSLILSLLTACGGDQNVTVNGGGGQAGTNAPSGTGTGNTTQTVAEAK